MFDLTMLGCATPYPTADNTCSGYLVRGSSARIWMDAGTGTLGPLQRYVRLDELDAIWISHLHADHSADLLTAYYGLLFADIDLRAPIPLYGPPGISDGDRSLTFSGDTALVVTHVGRFVTLDQAISRASTTYAGPVAFATPAAEHAV